MKKIVFLIISLSLILTSCEFISQDSNNMLSPPSQTEAQTEVVTKSYDEQLTALDAEYASKLQPIAEKYASDLSAWEADHSLLVTELEYLKTELSITESMYDKQINSMVTASYQAAEAAGKKAYNETYSKKIAQSGGYGSSSAKLAASDAQRIAYEKTLASYQGQINSLKNEKSRSLIPIQSKIELQNSLIISSMQKKQIIEDTRSNNLKNLDQWYTAQKNILDESYGK